MLNRGFKTRKVGALKPKGIKRRPLKIKPKKRRKKGEITKLKAILWKLLREITIKKYGRQCFTCGKSGLDGGNCQLGHFINSSTCSVELRYDPKHLRIQCYHCNINLSGNWIAFERGLVKEQIDVMELKTRNEQTKGITYSKEWFESKITEYTSLLNTL